MTAEPSADPSLKGSANPSADAGPVDLPRCPCCHWRQLQPGSPNCEQCAWPLDRVLAPGAVT